MPWLATGHWEQGYTGRCRAWEAAFDRRCCRDDRAVLRSDLDLLGAAAGRRWHCDARGRRIHTCTAQAELGKHCERAASMNCMMPAQCRAFTACSALSSAVRGIKVPVVNERPSRFGRFKLGHNGRGRTRVPNEERELPAQRSGVLAHTRYIDVRRALT